MLEVCNVAVDVTAFLERGFMFGAEIVFPFYTAWMVISSPPETSFCSKLGSQK